MSIRVGKYTLSQQFSVLSTDYLKVTTAKLRDRILKGLNAKLQTWENLVVRALSKDIRSVPSEVSPNSHSATKDRSRLFPYMRSGHLRDSVKTRAMIKATTSKAKLTFSVRASINTPRAKYTNDGGRAKQPSNWLGWMDDIMVGDGRGVVKQSVREIFTDFANTRRNLMF